MPPELELPLPLEHENKRGNKKDNKTIKIMPPLNIKPPI